MSSDDMEIPETMLGEILEHDQVETLVFPSPTGYMLTSFGFPLPI